MPLLSAGRSEPSADVRSRTMRAVKSKDTGPEILVRQFLHSLGLRYRLHDQRLPGRPDLIFPRYRAVLFVHGCFWHQHPDCPAADRPGSHLDYWTKKLDGNVARDHRQRTELEGAGWKVMVIWECETRNQKALIRIADAIRNSHPPE